MDLITLHTPRIVLRKLQLRDSHDVFEYAHDPEVTRYLTWDTHRTEQDSLAFIRFVLDKYDRKQPADWGLELRETGKIIGTCGIVTIEESACRGEIGYAMSREYWGRGLMTEVVKKVIAFGFRTLNLNRLEAICDTPNIGSSRVMEKSGMTFEGVLRQHDRIKGTFRDIKMYSILRQEFLAGLGSLVFKS